VAIGQKVEDQKIPTPGMLVELRVTRDRRLWCVVKGYAPVLGSQSLILSNVNSAWAPQDCTPLAPAPTVGGLRAALRDMGFNADGYLAGETGSFIAIVHGRYGVIIDFDPCGITLNTYEAHMRDMQKYGTLLAYTEQLGWERDGRA